MGRMKELAIEQQERFEAIIKGVRGYLKVHYGVDPEYKSKYIHGLIIIDHKYLDFDYDTTTGRTKIKQTGEQFVIKRYGTGFTPSNTNSCNCDVIPETKECTCDLWKGCTCGAIKPYKQKWT